MKTDMSIFEDYKIRCVYDEDAEIWRFSVIDIIQVLTQQKDYQTSRKYWKKLKRRLGMGGSQLVTTDGKQRLTDVASAETLLILVQPIPSPKAEPIKLWLAKFSYERMQKIANPVISLNYKRP